MARRSDKNSSPSRRSGRKSSSPSARGFRATRTTPSGTRSPARRSQAKGTAHAEGESRAFASSHTAGSARRGAARSKAPDEARPRGTSRSAGVSSRASRSARGARRPSGKGRAASAHAAPHRAEPSSPELTSTSVGELRREARRERMKKASRRRLGIIVAAIGIVVVVLAGWAALYNSPAFKIENVAVNGVEHLTADEMAQLANVPADTTLLRVDTATIESRIKQNAWVADVKVNAVFPNTLEINVTERAIFAVVEVPTGSSSDVKQWAIAEDHMWLMPIPEAGSEAAKTTSSKIYEDAENALRIVDAPYGTKAEIGKYCTDANVNNALDILSGLTTELADRVAQISAAGTAETTLILDNGVEIAFGKAEDIRDKERVILQILKDNPDNVSYINVRIVDSPTWRAV